MTKIIFTTIIITLLAACQGSINKKTSNLNQQNSNEIVVTEETPQIQLNIDELISSLNKCYSNVECKDNLDIQLNQWLIDKNLLDVSSQMVTDEQDDKENIINDTDTSTIRINLSSDYLNNALIKGALNEWLTWKRPQLINTWHYYLFLKADMQDAFAQYNINQALVLAIMAQESGGKVHSRSRAGAGGLFQLMPATARRLGLHGKLGAYDLRFNPKRSAMAAAKYINEQWKLYDGDEAKVLAAYNSGENRFARLNKRFKNKSLWDKNFYYELPRETRHYIPVVIAAMLIFQHPEKFNVELNKINTDLITINLPEKTSLSQLAVCLGQEQRIDGWFRILRNINSGIKADSIIKENTDLKIPKILSDVFASNCHNQELMQLAQSFHESDFKGNQGLFRYRVKQGDSLGKIAKKYRCTSKKEIARLNNIKAPRYLIRAGKYLKIPQC